MDFKRAKRSLKQTMRSIFLAILGVVLISACSPYQIKDSAPKKPTRVDRTEKVTPKVEPKSKYGNPESYVVFGKRYYTLPSSKGYVEQGVASWYGTKFHGRRTSSGETYDMYAMTAAHKTLPLPTYARVTNKRNGRSIIVRINDRGPFHENRVIDLSYAAATKLGIVAKGTGLVEVHAIDPRTKRVTPTNTTTQKTREANSKPVLPEDIVDLSASVSDANAANQEDKQEANQTVALTSSVPSVEHVENEVGIFVQIGAFRSQENAYKLRNQYKAFQLGQLDVKTDSSDNSPIYKVWIGPLETVQQADKTVVKLNEIGHKGYKLVFQEEP